MRKPKAVALYSGGLDSTLAILVMLEHGVDVEAVKFLNHFGCDINDSSSCGSNPEPAAKQFGFRLKLCHLGWKFIDIVKNPKYGYGKNMNPCIDCRILMLREAADFMKMIDADFLITGEVVGQRPMSQMKNTLKMIDNVCDLGDRIVRPLSGKLLEPTAPEKEGLIKRDWLLDLNGRSRKGQMALAKKFGLETYASPAGGCFLTDRNYSRRLKDLLKYNREDLDYNDLHLLTVGRQFRLSPNAKLAVGRNEKDNDNIESLVKSGDLVFEVMDVGSPISLLRGKPEQSDIELAAAITARYSDAKYKELVTVDIKQDTQSSKLEIKPVSNKILDVIRL
ncbi:MAG: hypothetical protein GY839_10875 [candidate division Zixibacteria bacterium]|nr:hypothetical protein [candidate division Zixibacteria bacterium]